MTRERLASLLPDRVDMDTPPAAAALPAHGGVYLLAGEENRTILLASAQNIRRAVTHRLAAPDAADRSKRADLREVVCAVWWRSAWGRFETDLRYWMIARELFPEDYRSLIAFGPAAFLRAAPADRTPRFLTVTGYADAAARYVGPFATRRDAEDYRHMLEDLFDLCRYYHVLEQAPHGQACAYFDMGRCPAPCNGSASLESYRDTFARALDFAARRNIDRLGEVESQMRAAAADLAFERAASLKATWERARSLMAHPAARHAADLDDFRWLIVQRGGPAVRAANRALLKPFFVHGRTIGEGPPATLEEASELFSTWRTHLESPPAEPPLACADEVVWLVCRHLFRDDRRAGVFWRAGAIPDTGAAMDELRERTNPSRKNAMRQPLSPSDRDESSIVSAEGMTDDYGEDMVNGRPRHA